MTFQTRKRKFQDIFDEIDDHFSKKCRSVDDEDDEDIFNILLPVLAAAGIISNAKERKNRGPNRLRESGWWKNGYQNWSDEEFKNHFCMLLLGLQVAPMMPECLEVLAFTNQFLTEKFFRKKQ